MAKNCDRTYSGCHDRERNLPHWFQPDVAVFITFRTIDSLPREVIETMQRKLSDWLRIKGLPLTLAEHSYQPPSANGKRERLEERAIGTITRH